MGIIMGPSFLIVHLPNLRSLILIRPVKFFNVQENIFLYFIYNLYL